MEYKVERKAFEHLHAIQKRLSDSSGMLKFMEMKWKRLSERMDWPVSSIAVASGVKYCPGGHPHKDNRTTPGEMYAMLPFELDDERMRNAGMKINMMLCVSYDEVRKSRDDAEPEFFFVPQRYLKQFTKLNNCSNDDNEWHTTLFSVHCPERRLKLAQNRHLCEKLDKMSIGKGVEVFHENAWHPGRLRYVGALHIHEWSEGTEGPVEYRWDEIDGGTWFGVELLRGSIGKGDNDGVHWGLTRTGRVLDKEEGSPHRYFTCPVDCGLFVDASKLKPAHSLLNKEEEREGLVMSMAVMADMMAGGGCFPKSQLSRWNSEVTDEPNEGQTSAERAKEDAEREKVVARMKSLLAIAQSDLHDDASLYAMEELSELIDSFRKNEYCGDNEERKGKGKRKGKHSKKRQQ